MFFELLFSILISFAIGVLSTIVTLAYLVINGDLIIERTADKEKRRERKQEKRERKRERNEKEKETEKEKTEE